MLPQIVAAILKRPIIEIAEIAGIVIMVTLAFGFTLFLILRGVSLLLSALHIKKISTSGIECDPGTKKKPLFRRNKKG